MSVPLIKIGSALGILMLFAMGFWVDNEPVPPPSINIWEDSFQKESRNGELIFNTSADFESETGLKWDTTFQAKLPCEHIEETLEFGQDDENKTFRILDRIHYNILVAHLRERTLSRTYGIRYWGSLILPFYADLSWSEIGFLKTQFRTGVYLSLKVIGTKGVGIGQSLESLDGRRKQNCTYKFSSNLGIDQEVPSPSVSTLKFGYYDYEYNPMIIRVPRGHTMQLRYPWYTLIPFLRVLLKTPSDHLYTCFFYARLIGDHVNISLPK